MTASSTAPVIISDEEFFQQEFTQRPVNLDCPEHGVNLWILGRARHLWRRGYSHREIIGLLHRATRSVRHRKIGTGEIVRAIEKVIGTELPGLKIGEPKAAPVVFEPDYLAERASRISDDVDENYLELRSQFTCWNRTPVGFLHKLYRPGEHVWITDQYNSRHGEIWTHNGFNQRFDELDHYLTGHDGVWYLTAPIDGRLHAVDRVETEWNPEGYSFTVLESLAAWRYLLIETDVAPIPLWRKAVVQWPLPIVAIYESGGFGDHVLLWINAQSKEDFDRICKQYDHELIRLGACRGSVTARRLSRLPNCLRGQTSRLQRLLYLRPDADSTPICKLPPRQWTAGVYHNYESPDL
jgi:hypothetical protein